MIRPGWLRLRPVFTVNRMAACDEFLASWDDPSHPRNHAPVDVRLTDYGNISQTGELGDYRGHALSRWHPQFADSIEAGVRPLALALAEACGYITYTSCQGHTYPGRAITPVERHVGLLPRDGAEHRAMIAHLRTVCAAVGQECGARHVRLALLRHKLDTDGGTRPVVTLFFFRRRWNSPWPGYFEELDEATHLAVTTIARIRDDLVNLSRW